MSNVIAVLVIATALISITAVAVVLAIGRIIYQQFYSEKRK